VTRSHNSSEEVFLDNVARAYRKRSKAISRRGVDLKIESVKEVVEGQESDTGRIDITLSFRLRGKPATFRLHVWGDRWIWIDARRPSKNGWLWEYTTEGRITDVNDLPRLVERSEQSLDAAHLDDQEVAKRLREIWSTSLASTPRIVK